jgi:drug/metabolite transporter (DMT)-like permease
MAGAAVYAAMTMRLPTGAPLERGFWPAAVLTIVGAGIAVGSREDGGDLRLQGGEILIVLSFLCWAFYSMSAQRWFAPDTTQSRRTWVATVGSISWLLPCWYLVHALG